MHEANEARADWAENAVNTFGIETYGGRSFTSQVRACPEDAYTMIQDLIGDLLHLAVRSEWDPDEILERAKACFDYENHPEYAGD